MKRFSLTLALLASIGLAQAASHEHDAHHVVAQPSATTQGSGVLKAVKPGKVQIAHEPIPSLDWPQMTMWFEIGEMPAGIKTGDAVRFEMRQRSDKKWQVEKIEKR